MPTTQQQYLEAIRTGDPSGLRLIYQEYLPRINRLITNNGGSTDDARDIFQDAMVILYEKLKNPDFELTSSFYTLLYGICRNLWGNRLQKKSFKQVTMPDDPKYSSDDNLEADLLQAEQSRIFRKVFKMLGPDCQRILTLFFEKRKMEEIREIMAYKSISYTKKRKFNCKERLVKMIKEDAEFLDWQDREST